MAQARHVGKIVLRAPAAAGAGVRVSAGATYLITGGLGAIGRHTARWLVDAGARHLVLVARRPPDADAQAFLDACRADGATLHVRQVDTGDRDAMRGLLAEIAATMPPLRGIVHAAGVVDDGVLMKQDSGRWTAVLHGKAHGARHLHALTRDLPLDFFILYSAAGLLLGPAGQGPYAAANAELDALAHCRRAAGLPATSVAWGMWRDGGMAARMAARGGDVWSQRGLGWIPAAAGFAALEHLLSRGVTHAAVMPMDWNRFLASGAASADPWFSGLAAKPRQPETGGSPASDAAGLVEQWRLAPAAQRRSLLLAHLLEKSLAVLGLDSSVKITEQTPLKEAGLDSLMAVELRNVLTRSVGRSLPATLLFDYPTLDALAGYLLRILDLEVAGAAAGPTATQAAAAAVQAMSEEDAESQLLAELEGGMRRNVK
jgi:NAD(P)-dependent dehydrogenase (short-subunit alcohol dehydrogenase family)/acyl carrier protein